MFDRITVINETLLKGAVVLGLITGTLLSGAVVANETNDNVVKDTEVKVAKTNQVVSAQVKHQTEKEQTAVAIEDSVIVFAKIGPNEQVMSMDVLKGYSNLHQNLRRRSISLSERRYSHTKPAATNSETSK